MSLRRANANRELEVNALLSTLTEQNKHFTQTIIELKDELRELRREISKLHDKVANVERQVAKHAILFGAMGSACTILISAVMKYLPEWIK